MGITIEIKFIDVITAFINEKKLRGELALWRSPHRFSSLKRLESIFVRGVRITLFTTERNFKVISSKLFYYQTFFETWHSYVNNVTIKKCHKNGTPVLVYASAGSENGVFLLVAREKFESSSYRIKS